MNELGKPFLKTSDKKIEKKTENQCQIAHLKKRITKVKWKFGSHKSIELTMIGLGKPFRKNPIQKLEKQLKST